MAARSPPLASLPNVSMLFSPPVDRPPSGAGAAVDVEAFSSPPQPASAATKEMATSEAAARRLSQTLRGNMTPAE
jgi:hypothetical protein